MFGLTIVAAAVLSSSLVSCRRPFPEVRRRPSEFSSNFEFSFGCQSSPYDVIKHDWTHTTALIHSLIHSFIHSFTHSFTHSLIHSFIHSLLHSFDPRLPLVSIQTTPNFPKFAAHQRKNTQQHAIDHELEAAARCLILPTLL
jgi:hypothetical protein